MRDQIGVRKQEPDLRINGVVVSFVTRIDLRLGEFQIVFDLGNAVVRGKVDLHVRVGERIHVPGRKRAAGIAETDEFVSLTVGLQSVQPFHDDDVVLAVLFQIFVIIRRPAGITVERSSVFIIEELVGVVVRISVLHDEKLHVRIVAGELGNVVALVPFLDALLDRLVHIFKARLLRAVRGKVPVRLRAAVRRITNLRIRRDRSVIAAARFFAGIFFAASRKRRDRARHCQCNQRKLNLFVHCFPP